MIELREDQKRIINKVYKNIWEGKKNICIAAPTGAGKSILIGKICKDASLRNKRILVCVHLTCLISQIAETLKKFELEVGFIKSGYKEEKEKKIQIASIQSLQNREHHIENFDIYIFDEAHESSFSKIGKKIIAKGKEGDKIILGFTATPWRTKTNEGFTTNFDNLVSGPLPIELQKEEKLVKMKYYVIEGGNSLFYKTDFTNEEVKNACDRPELIKNAVEEKIRLVPGKRTVAFCTSINHAKNVKKEFLNFGVKAEIVSSETKYEERDRIYKELREGKIEVLTGVDVFSEGFDIPNIEVGLLLRPTMSYRIHHQQIGRIMRCAPGKEYGYILDQAGNCISSRLQEAPLPEYLESYYLDSPNPKKKGNGQALTKFCPNCKTILNNFIKRCTECEYNFNENKKIIAGELKELKVDKNYTERSKTEKQYRSLLRKAFKKGYDPKWAMYTLERKFSQLPQPLWSKGAIYGDEPSLEDGEEYWGYLGNIAKRKGRPKEWKINKLKTEFYEDYIEKLLDYLKIEL